MSVDLIRGKKVVEAKLLLQFAAKHSALPVLKTLNSAIASAKNNFQAIESNLYISHIAVNEGPKLKRYRARARGQSYEIQKKTSHLTLVVDEIEQQKTRAKTALPASHGETPKRSVEKTAKPSLRPEQEVKKPKELRGAQRFFRRKAV